MTDGAADGRSILLDFVGQVPHCATANVPSKVHIVLVDTFILFLQLVHITIAYESSLIPKTPPEEESESHAFAVSALPTPLPSPFPESFSTPPTPPSHAHSSSSPTKLSLPHESPYIIDLRLSHIFERLRNPAPDTAVEDDGESLPFPNTTSSWPVPNGIRVLMRARAEVRRRQAQQSQQRQTQPDGERTQRVPGEMDAEGIIVGSVLYFFYINRLVAFIISLLLRVSFWNQGSSSVWLEIGRILLKDVRYHSSNQTVRIVKTHVLWRYWIRQPTTEEDLSRARVGGEDHKQGTQAQSCRLHLAFEGFEWLMYNRTAAYDSITAALDPGMEPPVSRRQSVDTTHARRTTTRSSAFETSSMYPPPSLIPQGIKPPRFLVRTYRWLKKQMPNLDPKDLLPIGISAMRGVIIVGNGSTPNLLVTEFQKAEGSFGIVQARSKLDFYKNILSFKFHKTLIRYVENDDFHAPMTATGELVQEHIASSKYASLPKSSYLNYRTFFKLWRRLKLYATLKPPRRSRVMSWRTRKTPEEDFPVGHESATREYAIERKLLETPLLEISYYADVVGKVPSDHRSGTAGLESFDIGNGDLPPEWGVDVVVRGGFFRYGPWADRQRAELQRAFFPNAYHDLEPTPFLKPGDQRLWTALKIFIELRDETTVLIPLREASKNWQWDGETEVPRPKKRESALIHLTAGDSSSISYIVPMVIGPKGYEPLLEIRGDLPSPLAWNAKRQWTFAVSLRQSVIYLLRDHINMFTDLVKDWTAGPPTDYFRFIPMIYVFELDLHHYEINMYANDQNIIDKPLDVDENAINIIDKPLDVDENAIVTMAGPRLHLEAQIPSDTYRPDATAIPILVEASSISFAISVPKWNTHSSSHANRIAQVGLFRLDSSYRYYADVHEEHIEQFDLNIAIRDVAFKPLGWVIRYCMVLRENYLGMFTNFTTLNEYLDKRRRNIPIGDPVEPKFRPGKSNILQVEILLSVINMQLLLPAGLPGYEITDPGLESVPSDKGFGACVIVALPELQLQFRLHDYYMEMSLNIDTITACAETNCRESDFLGRKYELSKEALVIEGGENIPSLLNRDTETHSGIDITANRMFGPQPRTSTYICVWEICLGHIKGVLSASEGRILAAAGNTFILNFGDMVNAPAAEFSLPSDPDVTFMKLAVSAVNLTWLAGNAAVEIVVSSGVTLETNDLASDFYRKVMSICIPQVTLKVLVTNNAQHRSWLEAVDAKLDVNIDLYSAPAGWRESARLQNEFIKIQDVPTGRAKLMKESWLHDCRGNHKNGLHLPQPRLSRKVEAREKRQPSLSRQGDGHERDASQLRGHSSRVSDSDGEEGVSEADRDARLAQSRTFSPPAHQPNSTLEREQQSMSSGDESDDEDLTDGGTSDGDWSDN
ncbi:hypothetical protein HWV62_26142, partial [Athelia sp. TMB]